MKHTLREISDQEFLEFAHTADHTNYLQSAEMARLRRARGYTTEFIGLFAVDSSGKRLVLAALLTSKPAAIGPIFQIDGGPIGDLDHLKAFLESLHPYLKKKGAIFCQITPHMILQNLSSEGEITATHNQTPLKVLEENCVESPVNFSAQLPWQYIKNLEGLDAESLLMSFNQTSRQMYKKGLKSHLVVEEEKDFADLVKLFEITADRQNFSDKGIEYYTELRKAFGQRVRFITVRKDNEVIAGGAFILDNDELIHLFGGSKKEFSGSTGAPTFLQVYAMRLAIREGFNKYNFYGISGNFDGSDRILRFKQAFRGEIEHYPEPFDLIISKLKYKLWRTISTRK